MDECKIILGDAVYINGMRIGTVSSYAINADTEGLPSVTITFSPARLDVVHHADTFTKD